MAADSSKELFEEELYRILPDLYDLDVLRHSSLVPLFGLENQANAPLKLQHLLLDAIEALRPETTTPAGAKAWRFFNILHYRYTEQYTQRGVAIDLSLSVRQVRRQEKTAQRVLADYLWTQHNLESRAHILASLRPLSSQDGSLGQHDTPSRDQELAWLEKNIPSEQVELCDLIRAVLGTAQPHLQMLHVSAKCQLPDGPISLNVNQTSVKQAILLLIATAAQYASEGQINIVAQILPQQEEVQVQIEACPADPATITEITPPTSQVVQKLVNMSGGSLETDVDIEAAIPFKAMVNLPLEENVAVLIIDDNADTLTLIERYLAGSRYHFHATVNPQEILSLAEEVKPSIIVLDVMLPGVDGWEVLGRLREHPQLGSVPVIVCTILPQEKFALALGAATFLRKPISRETLLLALDQTLQKPR